MVLVGNGSACSYSSRRKFGPSTHPLERRAKEAPMLDQQRQSRMPKADRRKRVDGTCNSCSVLAMGWLNAGGVSLMRGSCKLSSIRMVASGNGQGQRQWRAVRGGDGSSWNQNLIQGQQAVAQNRGQMHALFPDASGRGQWAYLPDAPVLSALPAQPAVPALPPPPPIQGRLAFMPGDQANGAAVAGISSC